MKRWGAALLAGLLMLPGGARAISVGAGIFVGPTFPIAQDDNGNGVQYGLRLPVHVIPLLTVEPFYAHSNLGDVTETFNGLEYTRSGHDIDTFGATLALGGVGLAAGMPFYPYASISSNKLTRDGSEDVTETGYEFGLGLGISLPPGISLGVRGGAALITTGDTSRKYINVNAGISTKIFGLP